MARKLRACWLLALAALLACAPASAFAQPVGMAAPYEYLGWGDPQPPASVVGSSGVESLTLAFVLSHGACNPRWDGRRPLSGGVDQSAIEAVRAAGGEVDVSFGGWSGKKLGNACKTVPALAAAYQKVIDAYSLHAIDIDIEHGEMASRKVRARVAEALARVQGANPGLEISVTLGTAESGPEADGRSLIADAAQAGLMPSAWTVMPFDFGPPATDMGHASIRAVEGLAADVAATYHVSATFAYEHAGISSMNGRTDEASETVGLTDFQTMLDFARARHLARFTFWSVDRDRPCGAAGGNGGGADECSGIEQAPYAFSDLVASYHG
jgi:chitinase